jgi:hypothetical protein
VLDFICIAADAHYTYINGVYRFAPKRVAKPSTRRVKIPDQEKQYGR